MHLTMGAYAVDLLCDRQEQPVSLHTKMVNSQVDFDVDEALAMEKKISDYQFEVGKNLSI